MRTLSKVLESGLENCLSISMLNLSDKLVPTKGFFRNHLTNSLWKYLVLEPLLNVDKKFPDPFNTRGRGEFFTLAYSGETEVSSVTSSGKCPSCRLALLYVVLAVMWASPASVAVTSMM
jgi:hypothetical protein